MKTGDCKVESSVQISEYLINQAKFKGYKVKAIKGGLESSYIAFWLRSLAKHPKKADFKEASLDIQKIFSGVDMVKRLGTMIIELSDAKKQIAGYVCLYKNPNADELELVELSVSLEYQRQGLGSFLMDCSLDVAKNKGVNCIVFDPLDSAEKFYKKYANVIISEDGVWSINVPVTKLSVNEISPYLNVEMSEKYKMKAIPSVLYDLV